MQERVVMFESALRRAQQLALAKPGFTPVVSIIRQLEYLRDVENGDQPPGRLGEINIGLLAAREIEGLDDVLADDLHRCAAEVRKMSRELQ